MTRAFILLALALLLAPRPAEGPSSADLVKTWDREHVSTPIAALVDHAELERRIEGLQTDPSGTIHVKQIGVSLEKRGIYDISFGSGPFVVLLWSQMHGDEPIATSALFDIYAYVQRHRDDPQVARMLRALTVHTIPMLNPDGAERFQRRTAQGIDLNRDALLLQSPEGVLLKNLRDEIHPRLGFNLHNEGWKTTSGRPPVPAAISLLAVAYDEANSVNDGRLLAKKVGGVVRDALEPLAPGRIAKYDDAFEVRAFGDNLTKWGTPVLLIESGPWPDVRPDPPLIRLNFVAILRALGSLADGSAERSDPARYDSLAKNEQLGFYIKVTNVTIVNNNGLPPFHGDVGIDVARRVRIENGERKYFQMLTINDVGDLRTYAGVFVIDGTGLTLMPSGPGVAEGTRHGHDTSTPDIWADDILAGHPVTLPWPGQLLPMQPAELSLVSVTATAIDVRRVFHAMEEIR